MSRDMIQEDLDALFVDACSGLPACGAELEQHAATLRQLVCQKLLAEYATNLAENIEELLGPAEEPKEPGEMPTEAPAEPAAPDPESGRW